MLRDGTDRHTDTQTDGHGDSMTNSAQWGRVGEKYSDIWYFLLFVLLSAHIERFSASFELLAILDHQFHGQN